MLGSIWQGLNGVWSGLSCWGFLNDSNMSTSRLEKVGKSSVTCLTIVKAKAFSPAKLFFFCNELGTCQVHGIGVRNNLLGGDGRNNSLSKGKSMLLIGFDREL